MRVERVGVGEGVFRMQILFVYGVLGLVPSCLLLDGSGKFAE